MQKKELNRQLREIKKETENIKRSAGGKVYDYDPKIGSGILVTFTKKRGE